MKYIVVDITNDTLKDKAKLFVRLVYRMSKTETLAEDVTTSWDKVHTHPTLSLKAWEYDETRGYPISLSKEAQALVDLLYPNASAAKKQQIKTFIENNDTATIEQMLPNTLPSGIELKTEAEMISEGWEL